VYGRHPAGSREVRAKTNDGRTIADWQGSPLPQGASVTEPSIIESPFGPLTGLRGTA